MPISTATPEIPAPKEASPMVWFRRACIAVAVGAALTVPAAPASAQSQVTYSLAGVEIAATSIQGTFVGVAISPDDFGTWRAVVLHEPLEDTAKIFGGTFAIDGQTRNLEGLISDDGEVVRLTGSCRKETFQVTGHVILFENQLPTGEFGDFAVTLTHYGRRVPGGCVTFFATIEGLITFTLTP
jgi:hypothetical protein